MLATTPPSIGRSQLVPVGTRLGEGGRYEVRQRIGSGGMAEVYRGVDTRLGNRIVAVKALSTRVAEHRFAGRMRTLFVQEAQALSLVRHENVVDVLDFGLGTDGTPYMVMEFLQGLDLAAFLREQTRIEVSRAIDIVLGVCAGVHACHIAGIIHRDLKPANIFLARTPKGEVTKVLDFSVAKVPIARSTPSLQQSRTDLIVGTPSYMSPEQAVGRPANETSDQYSIGGLLYRCVTGYPPSGVLRRTLELRADLDHRLETAMMQTLDPQPAKRFATVHELGRALLPFASPEGLARWRAYYEAAPRAIDPTTTGAISRAASSGAVTVARPPAGGGAGSRVTTLAARLAARAPEGTTRIELRSGDYEIVPPAEEALAQRAMAGARPKAPLETSAGGAPESELAEGGARPGAAPMLAAVARSCTVIAAPRGFAGVFFVVAALVLGVTATVVRAARRRPARPALSPPAWVAALPDAKLAPTRAVDEGSPQQESLTSPPIRSATAMAPQRRASSPRARRRRESSSRVEAIEFGTDGLPILR
jgi:serine/threonine protein kinase